MYKSRRNKIERDLKYKNHLERLFKIAGGYPPAVMYIDEIYIKGQGYLTNPKPYYKRFYRGQKSKKFKKISHRKVRRRKNEAYNGWLGHKLYDFWWEMY